MNNQGDEPHFLDDEFPEDFTDKLNGLESKQDDIELLLITIKERLGFINFVLGAWSIIAIALLAKFVFGKTFWW